jgi:hypothetical protein
MISQNMHSDELGRGMREEVIQRLSSMFFYKTFDMQEGLKYLGFILKPDSYGKKPWGG